MRAAKIDATQKPIVAALRKTGCLVLSLATVGRGCPDLLVYAPSRKKFLLLECKTGKGTLTEAQEAFHLLWPVLTVRTPKEALEAVGMRVAA